MTRIPGVLALVLLLFAFGDAAVVAAAESTSRSLTDRTLELPTWPEWRRALFLEDYNTRIVVLGTTMLGLAAGIVGSFTLLRKRALMGDALSHATLPGIGLAFMVATALGADGKSLPLLLAGAAASGLLGMAGILFIRSLPRLREDTALGIVLSVFFGAGIAVLGVIQQMTTGHAAGLEAFIYGKTASMTATDARLIGGVGLFCAVVCGLLFKELKLLCFDEAFAGSRGFPVLAMDFVLMTLVVVVTIIGLQAVGLVLMIALLVVPAAAARFWTERMGMMTLLSAGGGAVSCMFGATMSAIFPRLPSGAMIVMVSTVMFLLSMLGGPQRGVIARYVRRWKLRRKIDRQHLLRGLYEALETSGELAANGEGSPAIPVATLLAARSWSPRRLRRQIRRLEGRGLCRSDETGVRLLPAGRMEAARLVRQHRLWEIFLITHADIAPGKVDRDADAIEHVLGPEIVEKLEQTLHDEAESTTIPRSPHPIAAGAGGPPQEGPGDA
ncbi:Manganese transport system membrane protein MntB [Maioricimonas rarisocia]|uniref:Manganese transport system membrane protein MntB n=1 Tax=Maioricimonas rarisocia TaxID=2528026 RepID=A0A517Z9U3_9PLAN|nr:iron chelate uptake ABC transporter family permease subunit [Maioricimonas rarisocia]QDU39257.1 Manganese transport system membrane protein MntB [Maioricimonas rarisocia]